MNIFTAISLIEGDCEAASDEAIIEAWQYLHDIGAAYQLQGWYGRTARLLIDDGIIRE